MYQIGATFLQAVRVRVRVRVRVSRAGCVRGIIRIRSKTLYILHSKRAQKHEKPIG